MRQRLVIEAEFCEFAGFEVLDDDVCVACKVPDGFEIAFLFKIECDPLVAIRTMEIDIVFRSVGLSMKGGH